MCVGVCEVQALSLCMHESTKGRWGQRWVSLRRGEQLLMGLCGCGCLCNVVIIRVYIHHVPSQSALAGSGVVTISEG